MRIQGVTGDLPPVAHLGPVPPVVAVPVDDAPSPPAVAAPAANTGSELRDQHEQDPRRQPPQPLTSFDPPLIAQRAALGWPVGALVLERAVATGTSFAAVWAEVDRERPAEKAMREEHVGRQPV